MKQKKSHTNLNQTSTPLITQPLRPQQPLPIQQQPLQPQLLTQQQPRPQPIPQPPQLLPRLIQPQPIPQPQVCTKYRKQTRIVFGSTENFCNFAKGQLISKCPFGDLKSSKKPTKCFPGLLAQPLKRGQIKKVV